MGAESLVYCVSHSFRMLPSSTVESHRNPWAEQQSYHRPIAELTKSDQRNKPNPPTLCPPLHALTGAILQEALILPGLRMSRRIGTNSIYFELQMGEQPACLSHLQRRISHTRRSHPIETTSSYSAPMQVSLQSFRARHSSDTSCLLILSQLPYGHGSWELSHPGSALKY